MESLWARQTFSDRDVRRFVEPSASQPGQVEGTRLHVFRSELDGNNWLKEETALLENTGAWADWLGNVKTKGSQGDVLALVISPRKEPDNQRETIRDHPALLKYLSMKISTFESIVEGLFLHPSISVHVKHGSPAISRIKLSDRRVYTFRLEHTLPHQTAMTVTYFPGSTTCSHSLDTSQKTHGIILGYEDDDIKELRTILKKCKQAIFSPFTLIKAYLLVERKRRFREVNNNITAFQTVLQNYGRLPVDDEAIEENSSDEDVGVKSFLTIIGDRRRRSRKERSSKLSPIGSANNPKDLIRLYLVVCTLKNALAAWNVQIKAFRDVIDRGEFGAASEADIDPDEYLRRLMEEYDVKINKCDLVLQGASLAFQMETAHLSRLDTQIALRDGKQMKAIALLTMIFLPATFVATLLAIPHFGATQQTQSFPPWAWYLIIFLPLTTVVLGGYFTWVSCYKASSLEHSLKLA